ncbi:MAG: sugar phosphate isomerase/epimerase family protein [Planctomycetota bacterium]|nr:sugar phosphate isomerase/epimerase family protein [Planctomycetota bacterium]
MHGAQGLPYPVASQADVHFARTFEPFFSSLGVHPDLLLEDIEETCKMPPAFWSQLRIEYSQLGLEPSVHLPFYGLNLGSRSNMIRAVSFRNIVSGLRIAGAVGAKLGVMHTGYIAQTPRRAMSKWVENFAPHFERLTAIARDLGIQLLLENTWEHDTELFERIADTIKGEYHYCLDIGHVHSFSKVSPEKWFGLFKDRIRVIHLHDNKHHEDDHLPIGRGTIDFSFLRDLAGAEKPPRLVFEYKPRYLSESLSYLHQLLK